jgi:hypothetical protein
MFTLVDQGAPHVWLIAYSIRDGAESQLVIAGDAQTGRKKVKKMQKRFVAV